MSDRPNLADPDFEPTDEQLVGLAKRAFAHVPEQRRASSEKLRAQIAILREQVLRRLAQRSSAETSPR